jgi:hypothetical protein
MNGTEPHRTITAFSGMFLLEDEDINELELKDGDTGIGIPGDDDEWILLQGTPDELVRFAAQVHALAMDAKDRAQRPSGVLA